ncbi:MAG: GDP-mannose 4,6-dehydratase [Acidihalobacter sp.]|uniref:GDP-mannose 4,6-dehydratase n=1 Tax=Acidihalobacter sp. TaxID=1872108 RepID=UPI00307DEC9F
MEGAEVLVTGASGFTGRHLIQALKREGCRVVALGLRASEADVSIQCDLTDSDAVRKALSTCSPTYVVHLAALSFVAHGDPEAFYRVNVLGTLNLLEAVAGQDASPKKILIASSANVYGQPDQSVLDEQTCPAPVNHYACSKLAMEHMVRTWFERLPIVITRPFNYTGPGQDGRFLVPKIIDHFRRRESQIELGNLDVSRDFSDVSDVVAAYVALLTSPVSSATVNICSGVAISLREIVEMAEEMAGYRIDIHVNPAFVRKNEIPSLRGDNALLRKLVGSAPATPLRETIARMLHPG